MCSSWNLCPQQTAYSGSCYSSSGDQRFDRLSGTQTTQILDAPDGVWDLTVNRDIFNKVQGAVRDIILLAASSYYYKIYIAAASAMAEQNREIELLRAASVLGNTSLFSYINTTLRVRPASLNHTALP